MKKEISPGIIVAAIVGLLAVIGALIFFAVKSDPAMQGTNPPPRFDPAAMAADRGTNPPDRNPNMAGRRPAPPPGPAPK